MYKKRPNGDDGDKKLKRLIIRNWIIMFASLALIVICYYFIK